MKSDRFSPGEYWQRRVQGDIDLGVVGQRSLGRAYNEYIYKRRIDVLQDTLESIHVDPSLCNILDIGCGSGYYVNYWHTLGIRQLHGVDISADSVSKLQKLYPQYTFTQADITAEDSAAQLAGKFSIITIFDVLYHITDNEKIRSLLRTVNAHLKPDGHVIIFDQLCKHDYMLSPHVKFRSEQMFTGLLRQAGLAVIKKQPLFVFLAPPIYGNKYIDVLVSGFYKILGYFMKASHPLGNAMGRWVYHLDGVLRKANISTPNHALFLIQKSKSGVTEETIK